MLTPFYRLYFARCLLFYTKILVILEFYIKKCYNNNYELLLGRKL